MENDPDQPTALLHAPADEPRVVGGLISDRFERGAILGAGGMGIVVEANDRDAGRMVAVKAVVATATPSQAQLLLEEARLQGRLDHPSIPPVFELGRDEHGRPAFAMRKVSGSTLTEVLGSLRTGHAATVAEFPVNRLLRLFVELCRAIEHAHARGVVHGDLKPGNVMIDGDARVYVIDWGIASLYRDGDTGSRRAGGTLGYMAPEQLDPNRALDERADVYALGCILFEILAHEPLFARGPGLLRAVLSGADARPSRRSGGAGTPGALDEVCVRATCTAPADRFASAAALAAAVTDWLDRARDQTLREELAATALAAATAALADPAGPDHGRALREAGRALALTPHATPAVALIRQLLATSDVPAPAVPAVEAQASATERRLARAAALSYPGILLFPFTLLAQGAVDRWVVALAIGGWLGLEALAIPAARGRGVRAWMWWSVVLLVLECTLFARYLGPFVVAPALAALAAAGAMMHPRVRYRGLLTACLCLPPLVPFALERLGLTAPTIAVVDGRIRLTSAVSSLQPGPTLAGLVLTSVALLAVSVVIGRVVANAAHDTRRRLAVQTWHLEQLVQVTERVDEAAP